MELTPQIQFESKKAEKQPSFDPGSFSIETKLTQN